MPKEKSAKPAKKSNIAEPRKLKHEICFPQSSKIKKLKEDLSLRMEKVNEWADDASIAAYELQHKIIKESMSEQDSKKRCKMQSDIVNWRWDRIEEIDDVQYEFQKAYDDAYREICKGESDPDVVWYLKWSKRN